MLKQQSLSVGSATASALMFLFVHAVKAAETPQQPNTRAFIAGTKPPPPAGTNALTVPSCVHLVLRPVDGHLSAPGPGYTGIFRGSNQWTFWTGTNETRFGCSVAGGEDLNGDGWPDLVIGATHFSQSNAPQCGAAFLFLGGAGGPSAEVTLMWAGQRSSACFGNSVATVGDLDGDGLADWVGSGSRGMGGMGRVSIFKGASPLHSLEPVLSLRGLVRNGGFGITVARIGDVNRDGLNDVLIGAGYPGSSGAEHAGAVEVHLGSTNGLQATPAWQ